MGGGDGGGDRSALNYQIEEQNRKEQLRRAFNRQFGTADESLAPTAEQFTTKRLAGTQPTYTTYAGEHGAEQVPTGGYENLYEDVVDQPGLDKAKEAWRGAGGDPVAAAARAQLAGEEATLEGSTRDYYTEQMRRATERAERLNRFRLADMGQMGSSVQADTEGELALDKAEGGTRLQSEVSRAVQNLRDQREAERAQGISLINQGAGENAIASVGEGLRNAFRRADAAQKTDITSGLFSDVLAQYTPPGLTGTLNPALLNRVRSFRPTEPKSGGRTTPTAF